MYETPTSGKEMRPSLESALKRIVLTDESGDFQEYNFSQIG